MAPDSEGPGTTTAAEAAGIPPEEPASFRRSDEPAAWWIKLLVWAIVAALCLAFAGLVWALAL